MPDGGHRRQEDGHIDMCEQRGGETETTQKKHPKEVRIDSGQETIFVRPNPKITPYNKPQKPHNP